MTNRQMMEIKGVDDEAVQDIVCEYCNTYVITNHPPGFICEGRFCEKLGIDGQKRSGKMSSLTKDTEVYYVPVFYDENRNFIKEGSEYSNDS